MQDERLLDVSNLKTHFFLKEGIVRAVDGVDFHLARGEVLGIVGESGCGKSVNARSVLRIVEPPGRIIEGRIDFRTSDGSIVDLAALPQRGEVIRGIRGSEINMIFQEPMTAFSPVHTIGNQVSEVLLLHESVSRKAALEKAVELFNLVGIPRPRTVLDNYPHQLSGGMRQRAMIAMALICNPRILIADEPTTAIDVTLQAQILRLLKRLQEELVLSVIFITHDMGVIAQVAARVAVMYLGKIVETGTVQELFDNPAHPYTQDLLKSIPRLGLDAGDLATIRGTVPSPFSIPRGCSFHPRCPRVIDGACNGAAFPPDTAVTEGHLVKCFLYGKEGDS